MNLNELQPAEGSGSSLPKRVGRGIGSGTGKTSGKGHKRTKRKVAVALDRALKVVKCHYTENF